MVAWSAPAVEVLETVAPVAITTPRPGLYLVDFGVRRAGVTKLKGLTCPAGATIRIRHAEILQHKGLPDLGNTTDPTMIYVGNLRSALATDVYTCSGDANGETWAPTLTYHGFRFAEVNVSAAAGVVVGLANVEMVHFASAVTQRANVSFTSATLTKLQTMALGAQRSNFMTVPTDCDQRDERLGWLGDSNLSGESMAINFDVSAFFSWWLTYGLVTELGHGVNGSLPDVVPYVRFGNRPGDVSWTATLVNLMSVVWKAYGDLETYKGSAAAVAAQLSNVAVQAAAGLDKMHTPYGDWCPPPAQMGGGQGTKPSAPLTSAFSYVFMVAQAAELADAAGDAPTATALRTLHDQLTSAYNSAFYHGNGTYDTGTQTALALALALGGSPDVKATQSMLLAALDAKGTHFDTGIIGLRHLFHALEGAGVHDTALAVLEQTDYPSLGFEFANELEKTTTNLWELPDAPAEGTGMNSRNHHMYSSFSAYLVTSVAGVRQAAGSEGFRHLELRPSAARALHGASATLDLASGEARFEWARSGGSQYDKVAEGDVAELTCGPHGGVMTAVEFASFGTPTLGRSGHEAAGAASPVAADLGLTSKYGKQFAARYNSAGRVLTAAGAEDELMLTAHPQCHAAVSTDVVAAACLGRSRCSVPASRDAFNMTDASLAACTSAAKLRGGRWAEFSDPLRLWAKVRCSVANEALDVSARLPVGVRATLVLPLRQMRSPILFDAVSKRPVKATRTVDALVGEAMTIELGSGAHAFMLGETALEA